MGGKPVGIELEGVEFEDEVKIRKGGRAWDDKGLKEFLNAAMKKAKELNKKYITIKFSTIAKFYNGDGDPKYESVRFKRKICEVLGLPKDAVSTSSADKKVIIKVK